MSDSRGDHAHNGEYQGTSATLGLDHRFTTYLRSRAAKERSPQDVDGRKDITPKRSRARAPYTASLTLRADDSNFQRDPAQKSSKLWNPNDDLPSRRPDASMSPRVSTPGHTNSHTPTPEPEKERIPKRPSFQWSRERHNEDEVVKAKRSRARTPIPTSSQTATFRPRPSESENTEVLIKQPETRPITQEQLVAEVKGIYAGLVMVESKCIEVDKAKGATSEPKLNNEQWQALIALHRTLLHEHHDFFLASQHPAASPALRRLASKYAMPARMWRHGIHSFLELLRHRLPKSLEHMLTFIYLAYSMMALLYETVPTFEDTWIECLGDLGRYRMTIEDDDLKDREVWTSVSRHWYSKASDKAPTTGRLYHHLAILARPNALQQLFHYTKALSVPKPFLSARESILELFDPHLNGARTRLPVTDAALTSPKYTPPVSKTGHDDGNSTIRFEERKSSFQSRSSWSTHYFVEGSVGGVPMEAFPDSGADMCFISPEMASNLNLSPAASTEKQISLANKKQVQSPGMVEVPWRFAGEREDHLLQCWILPGCVHDLVLGNRLLKMTETFTKFIRRIKNRLVPPRGLRLRLIGGETQRLTGFLNGKLTAALPDTGSDLMLISDSYAREMGLSVDRSAEHWLNVELADGTPCLTSGVVRDVSWTVGDVTAKRDFYVLDGLCVDVVLSNEYLFGSDVFSKCGDWFVDTELEEDNSRFCNIRLIGRYSDTLNALEEEYIEDLNSPNAFDEVMIERELARRDKIRDEIAALPEDKKEEVRQRETERQREWQASRQRHREKWGSQSLQQRQALPSGGPGNGSRVARWRAKFDTSVPLQRLRLNPRNKP